MDRVSLILFDVAFLCLAVSLVLHLWPSEGLKFWRGKPWGDYDERRALIIKKMAPYYLNAGRTISPSMVDRWVSATSGMSARETGAKLYEMVSADFGDDVPFVTEFARS